MIFCFGLIIGLVIGVVFTTICHRSFTNAAWDSVKCMAEQNYELVQTLKEGFREEWEDEGEEWKTGASED